MNLVALAVFIALFVFVTILGFVAAHWRKGDLDQLHEWGLGGRRFGTFVTWFLLGGDIYTAYTFIAVPALMFGAGAIGFFAVPYTIMIFPILFLIFPKLWTVAHRNGHVTAADYIRARFDNRWLALAIAITGIVATMPYIALQLVGMQVVIGAMGVETSGWSGDLPLIIAFVILAAFTYTSGLRAPAMIAVVKDTLIYIAVFAAIIVVPLHLGGYGKIFAAVPPDKLLLPTPGPGTLGSYSAYATLALGSALALFLYPHTITAILSASSAQVIRRNAAILPAYTLMLGLLALLGFMALALGVREMPQFADGFQRYGNNFAIPALFIASFPSWFVGVAFAAIAIGALVPAAIMSIAASNTYTRNIYREFLRPDCSDAQEAQMAKIVSLIVKVGALAFIIGLPLEYAIQLQLLGGIWIIQILPALVFGLYTRFLNAWALLAGWAVGIVSGTLMAGTLGFKTTVYAIHLFGLTIPGFAAVYALIANVVVAIVISLVINALHLGHTDSGLRADYA